MCRRERRPRRSVGRKPETDTELPPVGGRNAGDGVPYGCVGYLFSYIIFSPFRSILPLGVKGISLSWRTTLGTM